MKKYNCFWGAGGTQYASPELCGTSDFVCTGGRLVHIWKPYDCWNSRNSALVSCLKNYSPITGWCPVVFKNCVEVCLILTTCETFPRSYKMQREGGLLLVTGYIVPESNE